MLLKTCAVVQILCVVIQIKIARIANITTTWSSWLFSLLITRRSLTLTNGNFCFISIFSHTTFFKQDEIITFPWLLNRNVLFGQPIDWIYVFEVIWLRKIYNSAIEDCTYWITYRKSLKGHKFILLLEWYFTKSVRPEIKLFNFNEKCVSRILWSVKRAKLSPTCSCCEYSRCQEYSLQTSSTPLPPRQRKQFLTDECRYKPSQIKRKSWTKQKEHILNTTSWCLLYSFSDE